MTKRCREKRRKRHGVGKKNDRGNWPIISKQIVLPLLKNNIIRIGPRLFYLPQLLLLMRK